ncbi:xylulokinase [Paenibacillus cisolokensis]|uniref:Xylulose kinase n=1 Tax=Paenibacillus cisolokensis TaxID=1658519 RepID=A0ABQ4N1N3_9BACL|nr:xylulokinase [Paenibacillus cisolokensis]GIQ62085.1 xylulokinase [Paenibacillus cisolokensis]
MAQYVIAHDIGTTGNKATLYSQDGELVASAFHGYETYYPQSGWAEQDSHDWWRAVCETSKSLMEKTGVAKSDIAAVSFSGQMLGCLLVDRNGEPLQRAIIWADMRAGKQAAELEELLGMRDVYGITGHRISSSYSGAKLKWVKENQPEIYAKAFKMLQAKDYLVYRLTGALATDYTDACGTNCFDLVAKTWSGYILSAWGLDAGLFPELHASTDMVGKVHKQAAEQTGLLEGTPVVIGGGDGVCAAAGVGVMAEGEAFNYIGSSSWVATASKQPIFDSEMKTYTWVHLDPDLYSPNGTMQCGGGSMQWATRLLFPNPGGRSIYDLMNEEARKSPITANKLLFLPYLMGERSPRWNPHARGAFVGLQITHNRGDMARAVMEGVALNLKIVLDTFRKEGAPIDHMWVLGGGAKSTLWRQILADVYGLDIYVPAYLDEATSMGAAMAGAVGVGLISDFHQAKKWVKRVSVHSPDPASSETYSRYFELFDETYRQLTPVYDKLNQF